MSNKVSIIVPVYNAAQTLTRCVKSIEAQDYLNIEIILIYNQSTDYSLQVCRSLKSKNSKIKLIINDSNKGPSYARNQGINIANGYYVYFMDSDDYLANDHVFSDLIEKIVETKSSIIMAGYKINNVDFFNNSGNKDVLTKKELLKYVLSINIPKFKKVEGYLWNKMFILPIIKENNISFNTRYRMWEDLLFCVEYILKINKGVFWDKSVYIYCKNSQSITNSLNLEKSIEWSEAGLSIASLLKKRNLFYNDFMRIVVNVFMQTTIIEMKKRGKVCISSKYYKYIVEYQHGLRKKYKVLLFLLKNKCLFVAKQYLKLL